MGESKSPQESSSEGETKRKFREALDRKMAQSSSGSDHKDGGGKQSRGARSGGEPSGIPPQERLATGRGCSAATRTLPKMLIKRSVPTALH